MYLYSINFNNRSQTQLKYQIKEGGTVVVQEIKAVG